MRRMFREPAGSETFGELGQAIRSSRKQCDSAGSIARHYGPRIVSEHDSRESTMTIAELTKRVEELERKMVAVERDRDQPDPRQPWWRTTAGRFADDPEFEEIIRLGREYRESLRPKDDEVENSP
jgi:hypothetical protein